MTAKEQEDTRKHPPGIYKRGEVFWIRYARGGRKYREITGSKKITDAKRLLELRKGQIREGKIPSVRLEKIRFEELAEDFLNDYRANGRRSLKMAEERVRELGKFFGGVRAIDITTPRVNAYISSRKNEITHLGRPPSNATLNREMSALKRMFSLATKAVPPKAIRVPHIPHLLEDNVRTGFFEHEEFQALRGALPYHLRPLVTAAYWTGMRAGELQSLIWERVDLQERKITLDPESTKNRQGRIVYMSDELWRVLREQKDLRDLNHPDCPWVFFREGQPIRDYRTGWANACKRVGLEGRLFHDLRRTGVRNLVRAGVPERVAMAISGHRTRSVFDRYNVTSGDDLRQAAQAVDRYHSEIKGHKTGTIETAEKVLENVQSL